MKFLRYFLVIVLSTVFLWLPVKAIFLDVQSHPYEQAIEFVQQKGIVQGYPDGYYRPDQLINRAEFSKIVIESQFSSAAIDDCISRNIQPHWTY
ncbi:MAG: S-layer homology domain-containing protein, partial [Candidatus Peregrinibacteria bacterium]